MLQSYWSVKFKSSNIFPTLLNWSVAISYNKAASFFFFLFAQKTTQDINWLLITDFHLKNSFINHDRSKKKPFKTTRGKVANSCRVLLIVRTVNRSLCECTCKFQTPCTLSTFLRFRRHLGAPATRLHTGVGQSMCELTTRAVFGPTVHTVGTMGARTPSAHEGRHDDSEVCWWSAEFWHW